MRPPSRTADHGPVRPREARSGPREAQPGKRLARVRRGLGNSRREVKAEQAAAVALAEQQREQRLGQVGAPRVPLGPDVRRQPGDVPGIPL